MTPLKHWIPPISFAAPVFIGDSLTASWPLSSFRSGIINAGVSGNTTAQMLSRFTTDVLSHSPDVVHILGGTNDVALSDATNAPSISNIVSMAAAAKTAGAEVVICSLPPVSYEDKPAIENLCGIDLLRGRLLNFNYDLKKLAAANGYMFCDYYSSFLLSDGTQNKSLFVDPTHLTTNGYDVMWATLEASPFNKFCEPPCDTDIVFEPASSACTGALTVSKSYKAVKRGRTVTLTLPITCGTVATAAALFFYGTTLPPAFRPTVGIQFPAVVKENNAVLTAPGSVYINSTGVISVAKELRAIDNFTATPDCGLVNGWSGGWVV